MILKGPAAYFDIEPREPPPWKRAGRGGTRRLAVPAAPLREGDATQRIEPVELVETVRFRSGAEVREADGLVVELLARSTRVRLVRDGTTRPECDVECGEGVAGVDRALRVALSSLSPEVELDDAALAAARASLGFVAPHCRRCLLEIRASHGRATWTVDVTSAVERACDRLVAEALHGLAQVLMTCEPDDLAGPRGRVVLTGSAAALPGLRESLSERLHTAGAGGFAVELLAVGGGQFSSHGPSCSTETPAPLAKHAFE